MKLYANDLDSEEAEDDLLFIIGEQNGEDEHSSDDDDYFVVDLVKGDPLALRHWIRGSVERYAMLHFEHGRRAGRNDAFEFAIPAVAILMLLFLFAIHH